MPQAVAGRLITSVFLREVMPTLPVFARPPAAVSRAMERCADRIEATVGPSSSTRHIADVAAIPLIRALGFDVTAREDAPPYARVYTSFKGRNGPLLVVT